ncbi:hypothetical protein ACWASX_004091 [Klebsiella variicola]
MKMTPITVSEFVRGYCERSGITEREFYETQIPMPDPSSPYGWSAVSNSAVSVKAHVKLVMTGLAIMVPKEMTDEMIRAVSRNTELGGWARSHLAGAFDLFQEFWKVACLAAMHQVGNSPVIPDGYVMVPVEPNGDMLAAAQDAYGETDGDIASTLRAAMLAAAPQEVK